MVDCLEGWLRAEVSHLWLAQRDSEVNLLAPAEAAVVTGVEMVAAVAVIGKAVAVLAMVGARGVRWRS